MSVFKMDTPQRVVKNLKTISFIRFLIKMRPFRISEKTKENVKKTLFWGEKSYVFLRRVKGQSNRKYNFDVPPYKTNDICTRNFLPNYFNINLQEQIYSIRKSTWRSKITTTFQKHCRFRTY